MNRAYFVCLFLCLTTRFAASSEIVLYSFNRTDGALPLAGLILDAAGNLYGTTWEGGDFGYGTVFQLAPGNGAWTGNVLHSFNNDGADGYHPYAGLIFDAAGNLYGTTVSGGAYGVGTVFQLTPGFGGVWTEAVLHNFKYPGKDGSNPYASLTFDATGNLYGTTYGGGASGKAPFGTVFQMVLRTNGKSWVEKVLHRFNGNDGGYPQASLVFDADGTLYGTTNGGGASGKTCAYYGCGTVFQLTPGTKGKWAEAVLHSFNDDGVDGHNPASDLIFDAAGNLYGTTSGGGSGSAAPNSGAVFLLAPRNGSWIETVLYSFCSVSGCSDGDTPYASLIFDAGNLYGTTTAGGVYGNSGYGTIFMITP